jgi:hypothetical protein
MAERPGGTRDTETLNTEARDTCDKELVQAFQGGEKRAYDVLYRRHAQRVGAICLRILHNRDDAEEAPRKRSCAPMKRWIDSTVNTGSAHG